MMLDGTAHDHGRVEDTIDDRDIPLDRSPHSRRHATNLLEYKLTQGRRPVTVYAVSGSTTVTRVGHSVPRPRGTPRESPQRITTCSLCTTTVAEGSRVRSPSVAQQPQAGTQDQKQQARVKGTSSSGGNAHDVTRQHVWI